MNWILRNEEICRFFSIGGSVVECSAATRAARVRFPADAAGTFSFLAFFYQLADGGN